MVEVVQRGEPGGPETVHAGILDSVPKILASQILARAWKKMPELKIVVREGLPSELSPALVAHQIDIVIATEPSPASLKTVLFSRKMGRHAVHLVATPELKAAFEKKGISAAFPFSSPPGNPPSAASLSAGGPMPESVPIAVRSSMTPQRCANWRRPVLERPRCWSRFFRMSPGATAWSGSRSAPGSTRNSSSSRPNASSPTRGPA